MDRCTLTKQVTVKGDMWIAQSTIQDISIVGIGKSINEAIGALMQRENEICAALKCDKNNDASQGEAVIEMLPVCECGHVFKNLSYKLYHHQKRQICNIGGFSELFCPQCGKLISSVSSPSLQTSDDIVRFYIPH